MDNSLYERGVALVGADEQAPIDVPACPVCGSTTAIRTFAIEGMAARVVTCPTCGLGRLHPMPRPDEIAGFYPPQYYGDAGTKFEPLVEFMVRLVAARHVHFLARRIPKGGRVLDLGCGRGVLLRKFADLGFEVHGVEVSEAATRGADPRVEIRIVPRLADAKYPDAFFDQVVIWHVFEHVSDPRETLAEVHRILKPGGCVVVAVPNFSSLQAKWAGPAWFHLDLPRHLFHFPVAALRSLLDSSGFQPLRTHHFSLRQNPFGWVQSWLNKSKTIPRNSLYTLLQRRKGPQVKPLPKSTRVKLRLAYFLGMPVALVLAVLAALYRSGATVHIIARKR